MATNLRSYIQSCVEYAGLLVLVDQFSKACHLIPLKGLPTAMETAMSFNHFFQNYGLPEDTVSDRGPQFVSRVWKTFLNLLGVTVSLSLGYHPRADRMQDTGDGTCPMHLLP